MIACMKHRSLFDISWEAYYCVTISGRIKSINSNQIVIIVMGSSSSLFVTLESV